MFLNIHDIDLGNAENAGREKMGPDFQPTKS